MKVNRKHLVAAAVAMALSGTAYAGTAKFDINGGAVGGAAIISVFEWAPDNLVILDTTPASSLDAGPIPPATTLTVISQGRLGSFTGPDIPMLGSNTFTYQMKTFLTFDATATDADTIGYKAPSPVVAGTYFEIYYAPTNQSDQFTGCGYGAHQSAFCAAATAALPGADPIKIYTGSAVVQKGTKTVLNQTAGLETKLDTFNTAGKDNSKSVRTEKLENFGITLDVNTISFNPLFFTTLITSLSVDITHEENGKAPFSTSTPSDEVAGIVTKRTDADKDDFFGYNLVLGVHTWHNDIGALSCNNGGGADGICSVQLQTDASSTILGEVPEPHSLALLGLGLAGLGWSARRRLAKPAV